MPTHFGITRTGSSHPINEDRFGIIPLGDGVYLYAVCDGVGGAAAGEQASALALSSFSDALKASLGGLDSDRLSALPLAQIKHAMRAAAAQASKTVFLQAQQDPRLKGMASTLVAALVTASRAYVLHVGDSRLYAISAQGVEKMTRDHSYIQYLIDVGRISPDQEKHLKIDNYITQAIGAYSHVDGDFCAMELSSYPDPTYLLLCSDGLYSAVREATARHVLLGHGSLEDKAEALIRAALHGGSRDDMTAVLVALNG